MTTAHMLARSRAAQHLEECLEVLAVLATRMEDPAFRRQQAERIADNVIGIYLCELRYIQPRKIVTGLHRKDGVIGSIGR